MMGAAMLKGYRFLQSLWASYGVPFGRNVYLGESGAAKFDGYDPVNIDVMFRMDPNYDKRLTPPCCSAWCDHQTALNGRPSLFNGCCKRVNPKIYILMTEPLISS